VFSVRFSGTIVFVCCFLISASLLFLPYVVEGRLCLAHSRALSPFRVHFLFSPFSPFRFLSSELFLVVAVPLVRRSGDPGSPDTHRPVPVWWMARTFSVHSRLYDDISAPCGSGPHNFVHPRTSLGHTQIHSCCPPYGGSSNIRLRLQLLFVTSLHSHCIDSACRQPTAFWRRVSILYQMSINRWSSVQ